MANDQLDGVLKYGEALSISNNFCRSKDINIDGDFVSFISYNMHGLSQGITQLNSFCRENCAIIFCRNCGCRVRLFMIN